MYLRYVTISLTKKTKMPNDVPVADNLGVVKGSNWEVTTMRAHIIGVNDQIK